MSRDPRADDAEWQAVWALERIADALEDIARTRTKPQNVSLNMSLNMPKDLTPVEAQQLMDKFVDVLVKAGE
jgi:enamine deaminase RidA (YjgF/YER057c/UK114 family)